MYNQSFPDPVDMQKEIDVYMARHDKEIKEKESLAKKMTESDEEGWIAVTKKYDYFLQVLTFAKVFRKT